MVQKSEGARIVLVGKSKNKAKFKDKSFLTDINPTKIPKIFISKITVTFDDGKKRDFTTDNIDTTFTIDDMQGWLATVDTKNIISLVEITLDLDLIYDKIKQDADSIFSKYF